MVLKNSTFWETMKHPDTLAYAFGLSIFYHSVRDEW